MCDEMEIAKEELYQLWDEVMPDRSVLIVITSFLDNLDCPLIRDHEKYVSGLYIRRFSMNVAKYENVLFIQVLAPVRKGWYERPNLYIDENLEELFMSLSQTRLKKLIFLDCGHDVALNRISKSIFCRIPIRRGIVFSPYGHTLSSYSTNNFQHGGKKQRPNQKFLLYKVLDHCAEVLEDTGTRRIKESVINKFYEISK